MKNKLYFTIFVIIIIPLLFLLLSADWTKSEIWENGLKNIIYLPPSDFKDLPSTIVKYLNNQGYKIPQPYFYKSGGKKYNAIKSRFYSPNKYDWAIMCSKENRSKVLVFISGSTKNIDSILEFENTDGLQGIGDENVGFSLGIEIVGKKYIMNHYKAYGGPKPPPINHDGIDFIFYGKASVVYYNYKGKWLKLQGAD